MSSKKQKPDLHTKPVAKPLPLTEGDYYLNSDGLMVFTAQYHLKRGFCCGNKCKHCPYGWENVIEKL